MRLIVFVLEADKRSQTDLIYIQETIRRFYEADKETSIKTIFMGGRSNYNSKPVLRSIRELKRGNSKNITVIYCVDTDRYESDHDQAQELTEIYRYCAGNQYKLIWFCHDIEEVFIGEAVSSSDKTKTANSFRKSGKIASITINKLSRSDYAPKTSNILGVLDRIFPRRK